MKKESGILKPLQSFLHNESSGGIVLIIFTILAIIISNTSLSGYYFDFLNTRLSLQISKFISLDKPIILWVNDAAMALFFLLVGLEIKRELIAGELNSRDKFTLPLFAALGGMLVPALLYLAINSGTAGASGWGIPMATDIAFAVGLLVLLGKRVPLSLKVFLVALAIVDDIGAILVIAIFYSGQLNLIWLLVAAGISLLLVSFNLLKIIKPWVYLAIGFFLWYAFLKSGIHATIAGVVLAFTIPARPVIRPGRFVNAVSLNLERFRQSCRSETEFLANQEQQETVQEIEISCHNMLSPLLRIEHAIHPIASFLVLPLFAFCNAGLMITAGWTDNLLSATSLGIAAGLLIGKPLGILSFTWISVRLGWASLPADLNFKHIAGVGMLAGIGFTMALFINNLAFPGTAISDVNKMTIFFVSALAALAGFIVLYRVTKKQ
ncbi:MAG: Na+/H+ antiporter NhaA [Bacteroidales bacterium]|nr:Na+/H+ antiporter NhaA [Bacteroidales bacterium]